MLPSFSGWRLWSFRQSSAEQVNMSTFRTECKRERRREKFKRRVRWRRFAALFVWCHSHHPSSTSITSHWSSLNYRLNLSVFGQRFDMETKISLVSKMFLIMLLPRLVSVIKKKVTHGKSLYYNYRCRSQCVKINLVNEPRGNLYGYSKWANRFFLVIKTLWDDMFTLNNTNRLLVQLLTYE